MIEQVTDIGRPGIVLGGVMHVIGLFAALAGGVGMLLERREVAELER